MNSNQYIDLIRSQLEQALKPTQLEVLDDSEAHAGHAGARQGGGHYTVRIASPLFEGKKLLETHRMIYNALGDAVGQEIHALRIEIIRDM